MTSRRDFAAAAGSLGLGAALGRTGLGRTFRPDQLDSVNWINVKESGVRGDGRTDDTRALERVFERRTSGVVYFPPGVYRVSRTIRVPNPVTILGDGARATYLVSEITDGGPVLEIGLRDYSKRIRGVRLAGFTIRGQGEGRTRSGGLRLHAFYDSVLEGVFLGSLGWGLECNRAICVQFDTLKVNGMSSAGGLSGEGIYLYGQSNSCLFNNLRSSDHDGTAFRLGYGTSLTLSSPVIEGVRSAGIVIGQEQGGRLVECRQVTLLNPTFERNHPYDMHFIRGSAPTIIGGFWGPMHREYVAPILTETPVVAIGTLFPPAPGGALRIERSNASALFLGCTFQGEVATYARPELRQSARLRMVGFDPEE